MSERHGRNWSIFILLAVVSADVAAGFPGECWAGDFTEELCCVGLTGNPICWDGVTYTFERCCQGDAAAHQALGASDGEESSEETGGSMAVLFNEQLPDVIANLRHGANLHRYREQEGSSACPQTGHIQDVRFLNAREEALSDVNGEGSKTPILDEIYHRPDAVFVECPQAVIAATLVKLRRMLANLLETCSGMEYFRQCQATTPFMLDLYILFVLQKHAIVDVYSSLEEGPTQNVTFDTYARRWPLGEQEDVAWMLFARLWRTIWSPRDHCACVEDYDYYVTIFANMGSTLRLSDRNFGSRVLRKGTEAQEAIEASNHCEDWLTKDFQRLFSSYAKHSACLPGAILENVMCMTRWVLHGQIAGVLNTAELLVKILTLAGTCLEDSKWPFTVDDVQYNFVKLALNWEALDIGCTALNRFGQPLPRASPCPDTVAPELLLRVLWGPSPLLPRSASSSLKLGSSSVHPNSEGTTSSGNGGGSNVAPGCTADFERACIVRGQIILPPDQAPLAAVAHPARLPAFMEDKLNAASLSVSARRWTLLSSCTEVGRSTQEAMIAGSEDDFESLCEDSPPPEDDVIAFVLNLPETSNNIWHNFHWLIPAVERVRDPSLGLGQNPQDKIQLILQYPSRMFSEYEWAETPKPASASSSSSREAQAAAILLQQHRDLEAWTARQWPLLKLISAFPPQLLETVKHRRFKKLLWGHSEMRADREFLHHQASTPASADVFREALWASSSHELNGYATVFWGSKNAEASDRPPRLILIQRALVDKRGFENLAELATHSLEPLQEQKQVTWRAVHDLERRSILQQAALFVSCDVMVAAVGAAIAWMMVMEAGSQVLEWLPRDVPPSLYRCSELWNEDPIGMFGGLGRLSGTHHVCLRSEAEPVSLKSRARKWRGTKSTVTDAYWRKTNLLVDPPKFDRWVRDALGRVWRFSSKYEASRNAL